MFSQWFNQQIVNIGSNGTQFMQTALEHIFPNEYHKYTNYIISMENDRMGAQRLNWQLPQDTNVDLKPTPCFTGFRHKNGVFFSILSRTL